MDKQNIMMTDDLPVPVMNYLTYGNVYECFIVPANVERSGLYLKLFKLVFGSVSLLAAENEQMLKVTFRLNDFYSCNCTITYITHT